MKDASWFLPSGVDTPRDGRIFCFPHAGGDPRVFLDWQPALGRDVAVVPVCVPGQRHRVDEPAPATVAEFADGAASAIAANADAAIYLFGHSFGALVAFEVARRLRDLPELRHLVASGCSAPSLLPSRRIVDAATLDGREFAEAVGFFGGLPPEVIADEELHDLLLPGLKADVRLVAGYRYRPAPPLAIDVSLINGRQDPHVVDAGLRPWLDECENAPDQHWADGGHFYWLDRPSTVLDLLRKVVGADTHVELI